MGIKRRRRETAIAEGKKRLPKKFLIYAFPKKISSISQKFLMTFFCFFFFSPPFFFFYFFFFNFFNPKKFLGGLTSFFKGKKTKKFMYTLGFWGGIPLFFLVLGGVFPPPSPYVEPPLTID